MLAKTAKINVKTQFKTQCKGDISHAFETAKIIVLTPWCAKLQMRPNKTSCCTEHFVVKYVVVTYLYRALDA